MAVTEADRMRALMRIPELELALAPVFEASLRRVVAETMRVNGLGPISGLTAAHAQKEPTPEGLRTLFTSWQREVEKNITPAMQAAFRRAATYTLGRLPGDLPGVFGPNIRDVRAGQWFGSVRNRLVDVGENAWRDAAGALRTSLESGEGVAKAAERVRESLGVTMRRATTIARTEAGAAVNGADRAISADLAAAGLEHAKEWLATEDHRTRHTHADVDGQKVASNGKFTVGGVEMDGPHDPSAPAREVVNCRCCMLLDVDDDDAAEFSKSRSVPPTAPAEPDASLLGGFQALSGDDAAAHLSSLGLTDSAIARTKRVFTRGEHTVMVQPKMTEQQARALVQDIGAVLDKAPSLPRAVRFLVPTGDPEFRTRTGGGIVGGYVMAGVDVVNINPKVAAGELEAATGLDRQLMPVVAEVGFRRYTIGHELGHIFDNLHSHTGKVGFQSFSAHQSEIDWATQHARDLSQYGASNFREAYAEAFVQWLLGGAASNDAADEYAKRYRWI